MSIQLFVKKWYNYTNVPTGLNVGKRIMKKVFLLFLILLSIFIMSSCDDVVIPNDLDASEGLEFEKVWGGYEVTGIGTCKDSIVIIPNTYKDKKVVSIGKGAFKDCDQIITIVIPENVKTVKSEAFVACDNLRTVYIQHGVEKLKTMLFYSGSGNMDEITTQYDIYYQGTISEFQKLQSWDFNGGKSRPWFYSGYNTIIFSVYCTDGMIEYDYHKLRTESKIHEYDENIECPYHVDNNKDRICDNCNETLPGFKHTHTVVIDKAVGATCKNTGLTEGKHCSSCGEVIVAQQTVSKKNHTESGWIIDKEPTTTSTGKKHTECTVCGNVIREESIPKIEVPNNASKGLEFTLNDDGKSYSVSGIGSCTDTNIVIPNTYNGMPVTSIGDWAFDGCSSLTSIVIPDSVTSIGNRAFCYCSSLTSIVIPNSVTSIGWSAFYDCSSLTNIEIPDSVTSIDYATFYDCSSLTSIAIPDSVTSIGDHAFRDCSSLTSIEIPDSVTSIGDYAFAYCSSLTSIVIPDSVTSIGEYTFDNCSSLVCNEYDNAYYIGNSSNPYLILVTAKNQSIAYCEINQNTKFICYQAFYYCPSLTSIEIPDSVTSIGEQAFYNCHSLANIEIPDSVTSIGSYAFAGCSSLTSIEIPDSVTSIDIGAFAFCNSLETITVDKNNNVYHSAGNCLIETASKTLIVGCKNSVIPTDGSVTTIGVCAFDGFSSLTSIVIPNSITMIDNTAFQWCYNLESIIVEKGNTVYHSEGNCLIETVSKTLIVGCKNSVIPSDGSVIRIGDDAFHGRDNLTSIVIPNSVIKIGSHAFRYCSDLTKVVIGNSVTEIYSFAFDGCDGLTSIVITPSITYIGSCAFQSCSSLTSITFEGTIAQWNAVIKDSNWNHGTGDYTIYCTDGTIAKDGTVTYN